MIKLHYYLSPSDRLNKIVRPLLRLLKTSAEVHAVVLEDCVVIARERPVSTSFVLVHLSLTTTSVCLFFQDLLVKHIQEFFVRFSDPLTTKLARLKILVSLATGENVEQLLKEFLVRCLGLA